MKLSIITILFFHFLCITQAQDVVVYKMQMNVREITFDNTQTCRDTIDVIWGVKGDTLAFAYRNETLQYFPVDLSDFNHKERNKFMHQTFSLNQNNKKGDVSLLLSNHMLERYWIRFVSDEYGRMMVFVTNVDYGRPSYIFSFGCNFCD